MNREGIICGSTGKGESWRLVGPFFVWRRGGEGEEGSVGGNVN